MKSFGITRSLSLTDIANRAQKRLILPLGVAVELVVGLDRFVIIASTESPSGPRVMDISACRCLAFRTSEDGIEAKELIEIVFVRQQIARHLSSNSLGDLIEVGHLMSQIKAMALMKRKMTGTICSIKPSAA